MELHHLTEYLSAKLRVYFLTSPKYRPFWFWSDLIARSQLATAQCKQDASAAESDLLFDHLVGAGEDRLRHDQPEQRRSSALGKAQTTLFAKPAVTNAQVCRRIGFLPRLSLGPLAVAGREKRRAVEGSSGAAQRRVRRVQTSLRAATSASMSASLCNGEGVRRSRSVPRGTVG